MITQIDGFLLTRQWRDTHKGIELTFWISTADGPVRLVIENEQAVCFIQRTTELQLPNKVTRKQLTLKNLNHESVDALYFRQQRDLTALRDQLSYDKSKLYESEIKPTERYLMERFITASMVVKGEVIECDNYREIRQPQIKKTNYSPMLKWISLDIETHDLRGKLYSIAVSTEDSHQIFMVEHPNHSLSSQADEALNITWCANEKTALHDCFNWIKQYDPDIILGWNVIGFDLAFLKWKCQELNAPFAIGRGDESATVLEAQNAGQVSVARIPGRIALDGIASLKGAFWNFDHYALGNVAQQMLGEDKLISAESNKLAEIRRQYKEEPEALAAYNLKDCELVARIFAKADLINFSLERARMTGLAVDRQGGSSAAFDNLYLPQLHRQGYVAPDIGSMMNLASSPGGYVMDSTPGLYNNVLVLDFKSLYPSIIRTFKIDPLGLAVGLAAGLTSESDSGPSTNDATANTIPGFLEAHFSRTQHILPGLVTQLWQDRDLAKKAKDAPLSHAIKIIMNSFYGVLGSSGCRFFNPQLASSITRRGHQIIQETADFIGKKGYSVIYGDTDSVFVHLNNAVSETEANAIGELLADELNSYWQKALQERFELESCLEIEFETNYLRFLMPTIRGSEAGSKKRYAGVVRKGDELVSVFKGLETVRSDWTQLAKNFQQELYRRVFHNEPYADYVREVSEDLSKGDYDEQLTYTKHLRRPLESYVSTQPPQVKAARKMKKPGRRIQYVITLNGPEPLENLTAKPDYQHYQDKQLQPVADSILYFLDTSFERLTQRQLDVFG